MLIYFIRTKFCSYACYNKHVACSVHAPGEKSGFKTTSTVVSIESDKRKVDEAQAKFDRISAEEKTANDERERVVQETRLNQQLAEEKIATEERERIAQEEKRNQQLADQKVASDERALLLEEEKAAEEREQEVQAKHGMQLAEENTAKELADSEKASKENSNKCDDVKEESDEESWRNYVFKILDENNHLGIIIKF